MADNNTSNKYKYIDTDIDRDLLIKNLQHNAQSYVKYKGWDESKAGEFYDALNTFEDAMREGRLSSTQSGSIMDSKGELNNGKADWRDKDGKVYSQEDYNALSDRQKRRKGLAQNFYANREVASYIGEVAKKIYDKTKEEEKKNKPVSKKFDLKNDGVWSKFLLSMAPNGNIDMDSWLALDAYDPNTKKRDTAKRATQLAEFITSYTKSLDPNLDFSESGFGTRDAYIERLTALSKALENGVNEEDYRLLNQLGGTPDQYKAFFTTAEKYDPKASQETEEKPANTDAVKAAENKRLNALAKSYVQKYNSKKYQKYTLGNTPEGVTYDTSADDPLTAYQNALNAANVNFSPQKLRETNGREYLKYIEQYGNMNPEAVSQITDGKYAGWYYIPESLNTDDLSVLSYNPTTHSVARLYYGTLGSSDAWNDYTDILRRIGTQGQRSASAPFQQQGGTVETMEQPQSASPYGAVELFDRQQKALSRKAKSDPKLRQPWKEGNNYSSNEFTATDKARLAAIAADITALVDPEPISAGVLGVGSDITNFVADIKEGYGIMNSLGNFAANLGLSALGTIPVFGDALGSGSKIVKSLVKFAPKINKLLLGTSLLAGVSNADEIIKSFSKIGKDGPENEMNMQDWRNVGLGLQYILGGTNAVRNARAVKKAQQAKVASKTDYIDVRVKDQSSGAEKVLRFGDKKDTEALKNAKTPDEVNAVINSHPSMKDKYKVATETETGYKTHPFSAGYDQGKWYKPWTWRERVSSDNLAEGAVGTVYDARKFHSNYKVTVGRGQHLNNLVTDTRADKFIAHDARATTTGSPAPGSPAPGTAAPESTTPKGPRISDDTLIERARQYRRSLSHLGSSKHSPEYHELVARGFDSMDLINAGLWKQGGRLVAKAQTGDVLSLLSTTSTPASPSWPQSWRDYLKTIKPSNQENSSATPTVTTSKNYGTGYTSRNDNFYENGEYGTTKKVSLLGIQSADYSKRSQDLATPHGQKGYNYDDAQTNTNWARQKWQADSNNRVKDFVNWARSWRSQEGNQNKTQLDMLADYNKIIDAMYDYKHEMGTDQYSSDKAYRQDNEVLIFNKNNKAVYGSANSPGGVNGWDEGQANVNGTTTAQRFIDITDKDVYNIDFASALTNSDDSNFKALFDNLVKDKTGRYYSSAQPSQNTNAGSSQGKQSSEVQPDSRAKNADDTGTKSDINLGGILEAIAPNAIAVGRYLAARNNNKKLLDIAGQMPVMLYDPSERHRWIYGDQAAVQRGYQAAGQLNHLASRTITSDGAQQQAAQMEALMKGQQYIDQGNQQNDKTIQATREANWEQEGKNQESRYSTAMRNRANLFQKRTNDLSALGSYHRANYESLNALLGQFETQARDKAEENKAYRQTVEQASLRNDIAAHLNKYGIKATDTEQTLINGVLTGEKTNLTDEEQQSYDRIISAIEDEVTKRMAAARGVSYRPFKLGTPASNWFNYISTNKKGGVIEASEKVTIQKMKGKIEKMKTRQKHLEARMNAFEKDLDRAQKSASQYLRGQLKK